jgi:hypothetical protein
LKPGENTLEAYNEENKKRKEGDTGAALEIEINIR